MLKPLRKFSTDELQRTNKYNIAYEKEEIGA